MAYIPALEILRQFYVFNPEYGSKDGEEHKKLLFYYPKSDSLDTQIQNVGFSEAVVKFADNFTNGEAPYHEVNTEKELHVYTCFEKEFLIGATFNKTMAFERKYFLHGKTLNNILLRAYETFRLFFGTFDDVLRRNRKSDRDDGVSNLKERLDYFYTRYLMSLKLAPIPLLDALEWINYMKLDNTNYLKVQTFVDRTLEIFPSIRHSMFLYNDRLLLHNLSKANLPCTYRYLVQNLLPISLRSELQPESNPNFDSTSTSATTTTSGSHGKFLTGPTTIGSTPAADSDSSKSISNLKLPSVFLLRDDPDGEGPSQTTKGARLDEYYLIVYRALNATLAMLVSVDDSMSLDGDFFHNLDSTIGLQLTNLASNFADLYVKERDDQTSSSHQYIYYNAVNLALTTTINEQTPFDGKSIPLELAGVLCDFREKITESDYFGDIVAKADGDYWIAAKKAGDRELYIVTYQKNANLTDVHEEIKRFCSSIFDNVFLLE